MPGTNAVKSQRLNIGDSDLESVCVEVIPKNCKELYHSLLV